MPINEQPEFQLRKVDRTFSSTGHHRAKLLSHNPNCHMDKDSKWKQCFFLYKIFLKTDKWWMFILQNQHNNVDKRGKSYHRRLALANWMLNLYLRLRQTGDRPETDKSIFQFDFGTTIYHLNGQLTNGHVQYIINLVGYFSKKSHLTLIQNKFLFFYF